MGASKQASGGDYFKIIAGTLRKKCNADHPDAVKREYEDDKKEVVVVYELEYNNWTGHITGLERVTTKKGDEIHISMDDGTEKCVIRTQIDSGYSRDFMKRLLDPNFKFTEPCTVAPVMFEETKAKKKYYFTVTQNATKMKSPFTKETETDPNSLWKLPPWIQVDLGAGKVAYNKDGEINKLWTWCTKKAIKQDPIFKVAVRVDDYKAPTPATTPPAAPASVPVSYAAAPPAGAPPPPVWDGTKYVMPTTPPPAAVPPAPAWGAPPSSTPSGYTPPTAEDDLPF